MVEDNQDAAAPLGDAQLNDEEDSDDDLSGSGLLLTQQDSPSPQATSPNHPLQKVGTRNQTNQKRCSSPLLASDGDDDWLSKKPPATGNTASTNAAASAAAASGKADTRTKEGVNDDISSSSSVSSSSDDDDDDDDDDALLSLTERRARNVQRNQDVLATLGLAHGMTKTKKGRTRHRKKRKADYLAERPGRSRGMLLDPLGNQPEEGNKNSESLLERFPGREAQIRKLSSLLCLPISTGTSGTGGSVPIMVTGPSGTGKTAVVSNIVHDLSSNQHNQHGERHLVTAMVDCKLLWTNATQRHRNNNDGSSSSMEDLVWTAYRHLKRQCRGTFQSSSSRLRMGTEQSEAEERALDLQNSSDLRRQVPPLDDGPNAQTANESIKRQIHTNRQNGNKQRKKKKTKKFFADQQQLQSQQSLIASSHATTAAWAFGRSVGKLLKQRRAILVIDNAERMLDGSNNKNNTSFLSQLLLVPQTMRLNVTIIVISRCALLQHTGLSRTSRGTIAGGICPIRIHFPLYRGKSIIKEILRKRHMRRFIIGEEHIAKAGFHATVFESFLGTLIQSLHDLTGDIRDFVRLGRSLWPRYILPLSTTNIGKTMEHVQRVTQARDDSSVQRAILTFLDQRILPYVRQALERGLHNLAFDSPAWIEASSQPTFEHDTPFLAKFLLLSAFVCQNNRPDKDKHLFSIEKNGKRRRGASGDTGEDIAYGTEQDEFLGLRPRAYPAERLFSLFVSMVSLNPLSNQHNSIDDIDPSFGSTIFHETVAYLRDMGVLHDFPRRSATDTMRLSQRSFWSSINLDEAQAVAKTVDFPLERYIL